MRSEDGAPSLDRDRLDELGLFDDGRRLGEVPLEEDPALDPVRHHDLQLIPNVCLGGHGENLVEFLERKLLGFAHEAEYHEPRYEVESSVETERTSGRHDGLHAGEGQGENTGEGVVDADGPGHALLTLDGREDLCRILKRYRAFAEGVADGEEVDEEDDRSDLSAFRGCGGRQEGETRSEQEETHERERDHAEGSAALGVDQEKRGDRKDDLDSAVAQGGIQRLRLVVADILEDGGTVEGDDVDTTHLLGKHDGGCSVVGAPDPGHPEAVPETSEIVGSGSQLLLLFVDDE